MNIPFHKYHGTGNDFIMIDNRERVFPSEDFDLIAALCHRRFGIGADGLILLNLHPDYDFEMDYFNSDGRRSSMCGNGGRCIVEFARSLGVIENKARFIAIDGEHEAVMTEFGVKLKMTLPKGFQELANGDHWIDTGSPHYVRFEEEDLKTLDVFSLGRTIRNTEPWKAEGTNVNFVKLLAPGCAEVRTYERGVEDETWSCGTGVTAVAEIIARTQPESHQEGEPILLKTPGGDLRVHVAAGKEPWLEGPAVKVFEGDLPEAISNNQPG